MSFTLAAPCEYREDIRKSRFLAQAAPVESAEAAEAFVATHGDPGASHNCWAWVVGDRYRFSDDGEPGGTAGRPILTALQGQGWDAVVVLVTRWYGGIRLGTGGLVRAYGGCAAKCLEGGERLPRLARVRVACQCGFAAWARLQARLADFAAEVEEHGYRADGVDLRLTLPQAHCAALDRWLAEISRGRSRLRGL